MSCMKQSEGYDSPPNCPGSHDRQVPGQSVIAERALIKGYTYILNQWE